MPICFSGLDRRRIKDITFEPSKRLAPIDPKKASYRDGYGTAARFLAWIESRYDKAIIKKLNLALRRSEYKPELFKEITSKSLNELWAEFLSELPEKSDLNRAK